MDSLQNSPLTSSKTNASSSLGADDFLFRDNQHNPFLLEPNENLSWRRWFWPWLTVLLLTIIMATAHFGKQAPCADLMLCLMLLSLGGMLALAGIPLPQKKTGLLILLVSFVYYDVHSFNFIYAPWGEVGLTTAAANELLGLVQHRETFATIFFAPLDSDVHSLIFSNLLALFFKWQGDTVYVLNNVLLLVGLGTAVFGSLLLAEWIKKFWVAFLASFCLIFFLPFAFYKMQVNAAILTAPLMTASIYYVYLTFSRKHFCYAALAGIFSALTIMSSFNGRILIYVLLFGLLWRLLSGWWGKGKTSALGKGVLKDKKNWQLTGYALLAGGITFLPHLGFILTQPWQYFFRWKEGLANGWYVFWNNTHGPLAWLSEQWRKWAGYLFSNLPQGGREMSEVSFFPRMWIGLWLVGLWEIIRQKRGEILLWALFPLFVGLLWGAKTENIYFALPAYMLIAAAGMAFLLAKLAAWVGQRPRKVSMKLVVLVLLLFSGAGAIFLNGKNFFEIALGRHGNFNWEIDRVLQNQMLLKVVEGRGRDFPREIRVLGEFWQAPHLDLSFITVMGICSSNKSITKLIVGRASRYDNMIEFCPGHGFLFTKAVIEGNMKWLEAQKLNRERDIILIWEDTGFTRDAYKYLSEMPRIGTRETKTWQYGRHKISLHVWRVRGKDAQAFRKAFLRHAANADKMLNAPKKKKKAEVVPEKVKDVHPAPIKDVKIKDGKEVKEIKDQNLKAPQDAKDKKEAMHGKALKKEANLKTVQGKQKRKSPYPITVLEPKVLGQPKSNL